MGKNGSVCRRRVALHFVISYSFIFHLWAKIQIGKIERDNTVRILSSSVECVILCKMEKSLDNQFCNDFSKHRDSTLAQKRMSNFPNVVSYKFEIIFLNPYIVTAVPKWAWVFLRDVRAPCNALTKPYNPNSAFYIETLRRVSYLPFDISVKRYKSSRMNFLRASAEFYVLYRHSRHCEAIELLRNILVFPRVKEI